MSILQPIDLDDSNYYSQEANHDYMSASLLKKYLTCEAATQAELCGEWSEEPSDAMLAGSYVHAWSEGTLDTFKTENPDMFTKAGELKAPFKQAERMIEALQSDPFIMSYLTGMKEFVITAEFAGTMWKSKLDCYMPEARISDIKTVKSLTDKVWNKEDGCYESWLEAYGYLRQLSVYAELERRWAQRDGWVTPYIIAISKEDVPDKAVITIDPERISYELTMVEAYMPRILAVRSGEAKPIRCESCRYCRQTKQITRVMNWDEIAI